MLILLFGITRQNQNAADEQSHQQRLPSSLLLNREPMNPGTRVFGLKRNHVIAQGEKGAERR
jgi:hypothetical protein